MTAAWRQANLAAMGNVIPFRKPSDTKRKSQSKERARGRTLCGSGFHKWELDKKKQFDVKRGKLVTIRRCSRCGETKVTSD